MEVVFEAFPQVIVGAFTMQSLQLWEELNILSFFISLFSLVYGMGDFCATFAVDIEADFDKTIWGALATFTDALFRSLFLAYVLSVFKLYAFILMLSYLILMLVQICIVTHDVSPWDFLFTIMSFPCSAYEEDYQEKKYFSKSQIPIKSNIFIPFSFFNSCFGSLYSYRKS